GPHRRGAVDKIVATTRTEDRVVALAAFDVAGVPAVDAVIPRATEERRLKEIGQYRVVAGEAEDAVIGGGFTVEVEECGTREILNDGHFRTPCPPISNRKVALAMTHHIPHLGDDPANERAPTREHTVSVA